MAIGVVIVSYGAGEALQACLGSLAGAARAPGAPDMRVVVVDNASPDDTVARLREWAASGARRPAPALPHPVAPPPEGPIPLAEDGALPPATLGFALIEAGRNGGFAAGVNIGLRALESEPGIEAFWILNPDTVVPAATPAGLAAAAGSAGRYAAIGGRVLYLERPGTIQSDGGGRIAWRFGRVDPWHQHAPADMPAPGPLDYVSGAHMLVSRAFLDAAGPMPEDYFLYFEEVDWCLRRGRLPLVWTPDAPVYHAAGASIGSQGPARGPSPFSAYWMARSRMRFVRRWRPAALPSAAAYTALKAAQMARRGQHRAGRATLRGLAGRAFRSDGG
ncbi:MAG: glycosyltransferase family 2 protein [Hasllibacter sp.]